MERVLILYATQTGNAEDVAERIAREALRREYNPALMSIDAFDMSQLPLEKSVIFVVSTTGQGNVPDSMKKSWRFFLKGTRKDEWLRGSHFAVFGLGDSGYQNYNVVAKKLHNRFCDLGGKPIVHRGLGDDQCPSGYDGALISWLKSLWTAMRERFGGLVDPVEDELWTLDPPKYRVNYHQYPEARLDEHEDARRMVDNANARHELSHGRSSTVLARVKANVRLTAAEHEKDVRHLEFQFENHSGVEYSPGDLIGFFPEQPQKIVTEFLERLQLDPDMWISVEAASQEGGLLNPVRLKTLVEAVMDISSTSPRRYFFEVMSHFAQAEHEKLRLRYFASGEGQQDLYQYNQKEKRTALEVLNDFPSVQLPLEWLVQLVPRLQPRYFSISSSQKLHPNEAHITVAVVEWTTPYKRRRRGLCSSWLADRRPGMMVSLWISQGTLRPPPASVPLILVGPGTGCAPFRAFIEERAAKNGATSEPVAPVLFFFGCRNEQDYLYKDFWDKFTEDREIMSQEFGGGFFVAFSRKQTEKVYVQQKIREQGHQVLKLLEQGALVFICGHASKMPADVLAALQDVVPVEKSKMLKQRTTIEAWS